MEIRGNENHFDNKEDAQKFVDTQNESQHDLLPSTTRKSLLSKPYDIQVDQDDFDDVFVDSYDNGWNVINGIPIYEIERLSKTKPEFERIYSSFPQEIKVLGSKSLETIIVPNKNLRSEMDNNIINYNGTGKSGYREMVRSISENAPLYVNEHNDIVKGKFKDDLVDFATQKAKEETQLTINGEKMYISTDKDFDRNYAQEYFDSGRYEDFKKNNPNIEKLELDREIALEVDKIARSENVKPGFITTLEILRVEEEYRDEEDKETKVYDKLCENDIVVDFDNVKKILDIENKVRKSKENN